MKSLARVAVLSIFSYVLVISPFVHASHDPHCDAEGIAIGMIQVGSGEADDPTPTLYVDDRGALLGNGIWVYYECNGYDGFQRGGGSSPIVPDDNELCSTEPGVPGDCMIL